MDSCLEVVKEFVLAGGCFFGQVTEVFHGFEDTAFGEVVVGKSGFGATEAGMIGAGFAGLSVP